MRSICLSTYGRLHNCIMITKELLLAHPEILAEIFKEDVEDDEMTRGRNETFSNRRAAPRSRDRGYALEEMEQLSDKEFKKMFRLSREAFYWLLHKIHHHISPAASLRQKVQLERNILPATKLAVTMRWLGGGSYLDICFAFGIAVGKQVPRALIMYSPRHKLFYLLGIVHVKFK